LCGFLIIKLQITLHHAVRCNVTCDAVRLWYFASGFGAIFAVCVVCAVWWTPLSITIQDFGTPLPMAAFKANANKNTNLLACLEGEVIRVVIIVMTFCLIIENSRMWKTQGHKCYGMTKDTNSYGKSEDTNCYKISKNTFWFTTSNTIPIIPLRFVFLVILRFSSLCLYLFIYLFCNE